MLQAKKMLLKTKVLPVTWPAEMVWDELDCRVKPKQPTSAQQLWQLLHRDCWKTAPDDDIVKPMTECQERAKLSLKQKVATPNNLKYKTYSASFNTFIHESTL